MTEIEKVQAAVLRFVDWLDRYGETSYDHQSFYASDLGRRAKALYYTNPLLGKLAVFPMIFSEAFVPSARKLFWKPQRSPSLTPTMPWVSRFSRRFSATSNTIGAVHFLEVLKETRWATTITVGGIRSIGKRGAAQCEKEQIGAIRFGDD
jgi:hypothetical protein